MAAKRILIDDGLSTLGCSAGVGNYSRMLYSSLTDYIKKSGADMEIAYRRYGYLSLFPRAARRLLYLGMINLSSPDADICHFTNHYMPTLKSRRKKYVFTVHDLGVWSLPHMFRRSYAGFVKPLIARGVRSADLIITVSETIKREIIETFNISENRVFVCPNAVRPLFRPLAGYPRKDYILFVGNTDRHKNIETLVRAFALLKEKEEYAKLRLIIAGSKRAGYESAARESVARGVSDSVWMPGYIDDAELLNLYNGAEALIAPSIYEGFGIPVVEAMACGAPVIASDIPVFREVAGDAALFYGPPEDEYLLFKAIDGLLSNEKLRDRMVSKGMDNARRYSPEACAKNHIEAYEAV